MSKVYQVSIDPIPYRKRNFSNDKASVPFFFTFILGSEIIVSGSGWWI